MKVYNNIIKNILGDEYKILTEENLTRKSRVDILHSCNYKYNTSIESILLGSKCPKCALKLRSIHRRKTTDEYKKEVYNLVQDEYEVIGEYTNALDKIKFKHNKCGNEFYMIAGNFLNGLSKGKKTKGYRCPICEKNLKIERAKLRLKSTETFKHELNELVGDAYTLLEDYNGARNKIKFKHNKCGNEFYMTPNKFLNNRRCPVCSKASNAEETIADYLKTHNICFEREVKYNDLKDICYLRFDFKIFYDNSKYFLLEFQGSQHYHAYKYFGGEESLNHLIKHDNMKKEYCAKNNIDLYCLNNTYSIIEDLNKIIDHYKQLKLTGSPLEQ